jgi:hypothetical protein
MGNDMAIYIYIRGIRRRRRRRRRRDRKNLVASQSIG